MLSTVPIAHERFVLAERLLNEMERRHGLPRPRNRNLPPHGIDRFLVAHLPETVVGSRAPEALDFTFTPTLNDALTALRDMVRESPDGSGAAVYVHDLDAGVE